MLIERRWRYSPRCNVCTFCVVCHACKKSWTQNIEMSTVFLMTLMSMTATTKKEEAVPSDFFVRLVRWFKTIRATGSFCVLHETQVNSSRPHPPRKIINLRDYNYVLQVPGNQIAKIFFCCYSVTSFSSLHKQSLLLMVYEMTFKKTNANCEHGHFVVTCVKKCIICVWLVLPRWQTPFLSNCVLWWIMQIALDLDFFN